MSVSLCSQFASSPACSVRGGTSSGRFLQGLSSPLLAAPFARRDGYYGRARINADRRLIIVGGAKWKRSDSTTTRKPDSQKSPGEKSPGEKSPGEKSPGEKSPGEKSPAEKSPSGRSPIGRSPSGRSPSGSTPIGRSPSGSAPIGRSPSGSAPIGRSPSGSSPSGRSSSGRSSSGWSPSGKYPVAKAPVQKAPEIPPVPPVFEDSQPYWEEFVGSVSGEWDGYSAEFNMFGEPIELPYEVVPREFYEWNRKVHDWQTQCPTQAHPEQGHLWYKVISLLPTVGCEADAATVYSVENCDLQKTASALAYHKNGSYTAVWRGNRVTNEKQGTGPGKEVTREGDELEVEQCLVHDKTRIRVLQKLKPRRHIIIYREAWEGPFRNGESLGGCAAVTQAFATEKPLLAKSLFGKWTSDIYILRNTLTQEGYNSSHLGSSGTEDLEKTFSSTFLYLGLPKDAWTLLLKTESGGWTIETGWLVEPDLQLYTKCEIGSSGELKDVSMRVEKRVSSKVAPVEASPEELEDLLTE